MSGTMPVSHRNAAFASLKRAAEKLLEAEEWYDPLSANDDEILEASAAIDRAKAKLLKIWKQFPECFHDPPESIPSAREILASIRRQEEAIEWARRLEGRKHGDQ